jgi:hypothetical protein
VSGTVVVVVGGSVVVVVVGGSVVVVVEGGIVVVDVVVVVEATQFGGVVEVVVDGLVSAHVGFIVVVGPPAPTWVADKPCVCGFVCGTLHVTAASRNPRLAVVVICIRYTVTVASAAGACTVTVNSGVSNRPGFAVGVATVTTFCSFGSTVPLVVLPPGSGVPATLIENMLSPIALVEIVPSVRLYAVGTFPVVVTVMPAVRLWLTTVVYTMCALPLVFATTIFVAIAPGFATPVTVNDVLFGTAATALDAKLKPTGALPTLVTLLPTAKLCATDVVNVIVPPFVDDHTALLTANGCAGV